MTEKPNWVERRAQRQRTLHKKAPEIWHEVRSALQDACESFNKHYCSRRHQVQCKPENGNRLLITRTLYEDHAAGRYRDDTIHVIVAFDPSSATITATRTPGTSETFSVSSDAAEAFVLEKAEKIIPDEVSRRILEVVFFSDPVRQDPELPPSEGASGTDQWMS